jgi:small nuclear ribonucleoprotein (snRNP)-like protein
VISKYLCLSHTLFSPVSHVSQILQRFYRKRVLVKHQQQQLATSFSSEEDNFMNVVSKDVESMVEKNKEEIPWKQPRRDPASLMALATSTKLASSPARPSRSASIPEEIDLEIAQPEVPSSDAVESTPLLERTSAQDSTGSYSRNFRQK